MFSTPLSYSHHSPPRTHQWCVEFRAVWSTGVKCQASSMRWLIITTRNLAGAPDFPDQMAMWKVSLVVINLQRIISWICSSSGLYRTLSDIQLIVQLWAFSFTVLVHCYVRDTQLVPTWMWWVPHDLLWFAGMWLLDSVTASPFFLHGVCFC